MWPLFAFVYFKMLYLNLKILRYREHNYHVLWKRTRIKEEMKSIPKE